MPKSSNPNLYLRWNRVGRKYDTPDLLIGRKFGLDDLDNKIRAQVDELVNGPYELDIEVSVSIKGGPFANLPFGSGKLVPKERTLPGEVRNG